MKTYIGDGVYAEWSGYDVTLTTENGIATTNRIVLEPEMVEHLVRWLAVARQQATEDRATE
jgi:hypothetical protein